MTAAKRQSATAAMCDFNVLFRSGLATKPIYGINIYVQFFDHKTGHIYREDLHIGFESLPKVYGSLFDGSNKGTLIVQTDDSATDTE